MISRELLDLLACPICRTEVDLCEDWIRCRSCGRRYPIRDGIPIMLVEEAEPEPGEGNGKTAGLDVDSDHL